jgi:hypothetical protein
MRRGAIELAWAFLSLSLLASCGFSPGFGYEPISLRQPHVTAIIPGDGASVSSDEKVSVEFSEPIEPQTVGQGSIAVVENTAGDSADVAAAVADGSAAGISGEYIIGDGQTRVVFRPDELLQPGGSYSIVITPRLMSSEKVPFCQDPSVPTVPFVSSFTVEADGGGEGGGEQGGGGSGTGSGGAGTGGTQSADENRPVSIVINEVFYDAVGVDTNGDVFIELAGTPNGDISAYKLYLVNGDDGVIKDTITMPVGSKMQADGLFVIADSKTGSPGVTNVSSADMIENFDPQNGPDCVQLVDEAGGLIDAVAYGDIAAAVAENGLECVEGEPAATVPSGSSLSRKSGVDANNNFLDFSALNPPSPHIL